MLLCLKRQWGAGGEAERASEAAAAARPQHILGRAGTGEALGEVEAKAGASELGEGLAPSPAIPPAPAPAAPSSGSPREAGRAGVAAGGRSRGGEPGEGWSRAAASHSGRPPAVASALAWVPGAGGCVSVYASEITQLPGAV